MVDIASIGASGLGAYQKALATVSNNIANLQTDGYVRQRSVLQVAGQDTTAAVSIGSGVRYAQVDRLYDQYAEENLRRATSDLKSEDALLLGLQQLQDAIGNSDAGLHSAFQYFFDSARELEAAPSSPGARAGFVASSDGLAARFRGLASTAANLDASSQSQVTQAVGEVNSLLLQLHQLNGLLVKRSASSEQPMQLLDQRDSALKKLSEKLGITTQFSASGSVAIYAGDSASGVALLDASGPKQLRAEFDPYDYGKTNFLTSTSAGGIATLGNISTGTLGGLVQFRGQGLGPTIGKLDELALSFGRAVNSIHRQGLDSLGRPGGDVFYVGPKFVVDGKANAGKARVQVDVVNADLVKSHGFEMTYDGTKQTWQVRDLQTGELASGSSTVDLAGLRFSVLGSAKDGDIFRINPESHAASTIRALLNQGSDVATAGKLATASAAANVGSAAADVMLADPRAAIASDLITDILPRGPSPFGYYGASLTNAPSIKGTVASFASLPRAPSNTPTTGDAYFVTNNAQVYQWTGSNWAEAGPGMVLTPTIFAASTKPIGVIPAGLSDIQLSVWNSQPGGLAVFTRDGRQLSGPAVDGTKFVSVENGFFAGATYSDTYLNQSDSKGYLGQTFVRGVLAKSGSQAGADNATQETPAVLFSSSLDLAALRQHDSLNFSINGIGVTIARPSERGVTQAERDNNFRADLVSAINDYQEQTHAVVSLQDDGKLKFVTRQAIEINVNSITEGKSLSFGQPYTDPSTGAIYPAPFTYSVPASGDIVANAIALRDQINTADGATGYSPNGAFAYFLNSDGSSVKDADITANCKLVISSPNASQGRALDIGSNTFGIAQGKVFDGSSLTIGVSGTQSPAVLKELGLGEGFVMTKSLAEDLLVFGVDANGQAAKVALTADYGQIQGNTSLESDARRYNIRFSGGKYAVTDITDGLPGTEVSSGSFDLQSRTVSYGKWKVSFDGIPADGDNYTVAPNIDFAGDNRIAAAISVLQDDRTILASNQTVQQEYESLVNTMGAITAQASISQQAQKVVLDHATQARDSVSGVNLDEELSDLLRFQQAYQANAQVVQTASRLFDSLLQKL